MKVSSFRFIVSAALLLAACEKPSLEVTIIEDPQVSFSLDSLTSSAAYFTVRTNSSVEDGTYVIDWKSTSDNVLNSSYYNDVLLPLPDDKPALSSVSEIRPLVGPTITCRTEDTTFVLYRKDSLQLDRDMRMQFVFPSTESDLGTTYVDMSFANESDTLCSAVSFLRPFEYDWARPAYTVITYKPLWSKYNGTGYFEFELKQDDPYLIGTNVQTFVLADIYTPDLFVSDADFIVTAGDEFKLERDTYNRYHMGLKKSIEVTRYQLHPQMPGKGTIRVSKGDYTFEKPYEVYEPIVLELIPDNGYMDLKILTAGVSSGTFRCDYSVDLNILKSPGNVSLWRSELYSNSFAVTLTGSGETVLADIIDFRDIEVSAKRKIYEYSVGTKAELSFVFTVYSPYDESVVIKGYDCVLKYDNNQSYQGFSKGNPIQVIRSN